MTPDNNDQDALAEYFKEQGFDRVMIGAAHGRGGRYQQWDIRPGEWDANGVLTPRQRLLAYLEWMDGGRADLPAGAEQVELGLGQLAERLERPMENHGMKCGAAAGMHAVTPDGDIYPCHRYVGEGAYVLGAIEGGDWGPARKQYLGRVLKSKSSSCSDCWARISCGGPCAWQASSATGESLAPSVELCDAIRSTQEAQLYVLSKVAGFVNRKGGLQGFVW